MFDFPDLDYEIKSTDLMIEIADWLNKAGFTKQLRRSLKLPIGPKMDELREKMSLALNKPLSSFATLRTQVNSFKVLDAYADDDGIEMRLSVEGSAVLELVWN